MFLYIHVFDRQLDAAAGKGNDGPDTISLIRVWLWVVGAEERTSWSVQQTTASYLVTEM